MEGRHSAQNSEQSFTAGAASRGVGRTYPPRKVGPPNQISLRINKMLIHIARSKGSRERCGHRIEHYTKSWTLYTLAQAVVCSARSSDTIPPQKAKSGLKKEKGMGKEWERGGGVTGRQKDRVCSAVSPLFSNSRTLCKTRKDVSTIIKHNVNQYTTSTTSSHLSDHCGTLSSLVLRMELGERRDELALDLGALSAPRQRNRPHIHPAALGDLRGVATHLANLHLAFRRGARDEHHPALVVLQPVGAHHIHPVVSQRGRRLGDQNVLVGLELKRDEHRVGRPAHLPPVAALDLAEHLGHAAQREVQPLGPALGLYLVGRHLVGGNIKVGHGRRQE
eukprot:scaffold20578_cov124-Isochrysis_galbana.AAC.2